MPAPQFQSASLIDNVRFNEAVIVPNALQGLFKKRPKAVSAATKLGVDGQAIALLSGFRKKTGGRPLWVRVVKDRALLLLDVEDVRRCLEGAPHPFAADPANKRRGMAHFQPDALTISRGELWQQRREWTDTALGAAVESLGERLEAVVDEEVAALLAAAPVIDHEALHAASRRITRRILFGDAAADDEQLSELLGRLMSKANGLPSEPSPGLADFQARVRAHYEAAPADSLAGIARATPAAPDVRADGQLTHWLFATQDTLCINVLRALWLLALDAQAQERVRSGDAAYARAVLQEAMRLWPTTPLLMRETLADVVWHGVRVDAGTPVVISNLFMHRDPERLGDAADRFTPEGWLDGGTLAEDWGLNHFSHGPQGCPGSELALRLGERILRRTLEHARTLEARRPAGAPDAAVPSALDPFSLEIGTRADGPAAAAQP